MYCKHCGKEIDENSVFCKHCGKSQGKGAKSQLQYPIWVIYIVWAISNFYLLMGEKSDYASRFFYPFTKHVWSDRTNLNWDKYYYDFSEYVVYVFVIPFLIFIAYRIVKGRK